MNNFQELVNNYFRNFGFRGDEYLFKKFTSYYLESFDRGEWICSLLEYLTGRGIEEDRILDVGCGPGGLAVYCARRGADVIAIDIDPDNISITSALAAEKQTDLKACIANGRDLPFRSSSFDVVFLIDVIEHGYQDAQQIIQESLRVCRPQGFVFMKIGNRLFPFEPHTHLFFVNWLPPWAADFYVKVRRREFFNMWDSICDVKLPSYEEVRNLLKDCCCKVYIAAVFSTFVPFVSEFSPNYGPFKIKVPRIIRKALASKSLVRLLSKKPFVYCAKDWFILLSP